MKKALSLAVLAAALLASCSGGGSVESLTVKVLQYSPEVAAGSSLYLRTDTSFSAIEVRVGGIQIVGAPLISYDNGFGRVFTVPASLPPGPSVLGVRRIGATVDSHIVPLAIVAPLFRDVAKQTGLHQVHNVSGWPGECAQSLTGIGCSDYDNDGDTDFFVGNIGSGGKLMRNEGDTNSDGLPDFVDATAAAALSGIDLVAGVSFMDYDGDGDKDLFVSRRGTNKLMQNQLIEGGSPTFVDVTAAVGLGVYDQRTMGVGFGDYDADGDLDLYVVNHAYCFPSSFEGFENDHFYRNDDGVFTEVTQLLNGAGPEVDVLGFVALFLDYDLDGDQDLFVVNDNAGSHSGPNVLWRNDGPGPGGPGDWIFTNVSKSSGFGIHPDVLSPGKGINAMGASVGDVNRDGYPDIAFSNIGPNYLLLNDTAGGFLDASDALGVRRTWTPWNSISITWGTNLLDQDNDGDLDLFFCGGKVTTEGPIPHAYFEQQADGTFADATWRAGLNDLGHGKASAVVDVDRDGFPDLVVANWAGDLELFRNEQPDLGNPNHWLVVDLEGAGKNRDALGAVVEVTTPDNVTQTVWRTNRPGLSAGGELAAFFGLGSNTSVTSLRITWPDGSITEPTPPAVDGRILIQQAR